MEENLIVDEMQLLEQVKEYVQAKLMFIQTVMPLFITDLR